VPTPAFTLQKALKKVGAVLNPGAYYHNSQQHLARVHIHPSGQTEPHQGQSQLVGLQGQNAISTQDNRLPLQTYVGILPFWVMYEKELPSN
jgi:hypothetical protein